MKYYIAESGVSLYTDKLLHKLAVDYGHQVVGREEADAILVSIEDITSINRIYREGRNSKVPVIAGGHLAKISAKAMSVYADIVWVGHAFEFFEIKSYQDILDSPYSFTGNGEVCTSRKIQWDLCPIIRVNRSQYYIWGGVGCKNKCKFCVTSWTEPHINRYKNTGQINGVKARVPNKGQLHLISNEYDDVPTGKVGDMTMRGFLELRRTGKNRLIRIGIEFPNERTRATAGKPIKDEEIIEAIKLAERLKFELQFFMIGGIDEKEDWLHFTDLIPESKQMAPRIFIKITNFEPQPKTPWFSRQPVDPDKYVDAAFTSELYYRIADKNKRVRMNKTKYPAHAIWRACMTAVENEEEYKRVYKQRENKNMEDIYKMYMDMKPWERDFDYIKSSYIE